MMLIIAKMLIFNLIRIPATKLLETWRKGQVYSLFRHVLESMEGRISTKFKRKDTSPS